MTILDGTALKVVQEINLPDGVIAMNIYYFETSFADSQEEVDIIDAVETWIETLYTTIIDAVADVVSLGEFTLYRYIPLTDEWDNEGTGVPSVVFAETSDMLPHGVSALVRAYSYDTRSIARKYIPGFGESEQTDGAWVAIALTALAAYGAEWSSTALVSPGNSLRPGVWDTVSSEIHILNQTEVVLAEPAYQRRRRPGVGI